MATAPSEFYRYVHLRSIGESTRRPINSISRCEVFVICVSSNPADNTSGNPRDYCSLDEKVFDDRRSGFARVIDVCLPELDHKMPSETSWMAAMDGGTVQIAVGLSADVNNNGRCDLSEVDASRLSECQVAKCKAVSLPRMKVAALTFALLLLHYQNVLHEFPRQTQMIELTDNGNGVFKLVVLESCQKL
jgi:hypothetical protein